MSDLTAFRDALGLTDSISDDDIVAALGTLPEPADDTPAIPSTQLPAGVVAIEAATLAEIRAKAEAGDQARAEQLKERRTQLVNSAVADGRIPPARKDHWLAQLEVDPGSEQVLAGLEKGLIPVGTSIGSHGAADLDRTDEDVLYARLFPKETVSNG